MFKKYSARENTREKKKKKILEKIFKMKNEKTKKEIYYVS